VLGGLCAIAATLDAQRTIVHLGAFHSLAFGERDGGLTDRIRAAADVIVGAGFDARASEHILHDMWEKWVLLATLASATCLMRAAVGDIVATAGGRDLILTLLEECRATAEGPQDTRRAPSGQGDATTLTSGSPHGLDAADMKAMARSGPHHGDLLRRRVAASAARRASALHCIYASAVVRSPASTNACRGGQSQELALRGGNVAPCNPDSCPTTRRLRQCFRRRAATRTAQSCGRASTIGDDALLGSYRRCR
jgi:hypothetical protein